MKIEPNLKQKIEEFLQAVGVKGSVIDAKIMPRSVRYKIQTPSQLKKINKLIPTILGEDKAHFLNSTIELDIPKESFEVVPLQSIFDSENWRNSTCKLPIALGIDEDFQNVIIDLAYTPELLIAGGTGSGKSCLIHVIIKSLINRFSAENLKFIFFDGNQGEFDKYSNSSYLDNPILYNNDELVNTLKEIVDEIDSRLESKEIHPYKIIIIDEFSDIMQSSYRNKFERYVAWIGQKGRRVNIHIIIATQYISKNIITGLIKAHAVTIAAFEVASISDSKLILGDSGAEYLLGRGDMILAYNCDTEINKRIQVAYTNK